MFSIVTWYPLALLLVAVGVLAWLARAHLRLARARDREAGRLERASLQLGVLHSLVRELAAIRSIDRILQRVDRECAKLFEPDEFLVALLDPTTAEVRTALARRRGERRRTEARLLTGPTLAEVIAEGQGLSRRVTPPTKDNDLPSPGMSSLLASPLVSEERVIGVLCVQAEASECWDRGDLAILDTIAQILSIAIEGSRQSRQAAVDPLTGLLRRERFFERLEEEHGRVSRYGGDFSILMIDLDGFKGINDRHGHLAGDRYLRMLGDVIRQRLRGADLGARYGGDEFALMLPQTDLRGGSAIAERIRQAVADLRIRVDGRWVQTTVSIGLASHAEHDTGDLHGLLQKADQALYLAKRAGRDRVRAFAA